MRRIALLLVLVTMLAVLAAGPAGACGGLVGENGTIRLTRTSTLAAHHNGIERYVTSFEFTGTGEEVGSIVPLPAVPTKVERGGDWTLQRLEQEVRPPLPAPRFAVESAAGIADAQVLYSTTIDALDITILQGGGDAVGRWALDHGFLLTPDAPQVLDFYSRRSKIFMAARFDATRAEQLGQTSGDGTPIMLTIPTEEPWVPLKILALGLGKAQVVDADVFLLTDTRPTLRSGGTGLELARSEQASDGLLADLRSDKGMQWVPDDMWLTYLRVDTPAQDLDYDLAVSTRDGVAPSARMVGFGVPGGPHAPASGGIPIWPATAIVGGVLVALVRVAHGRRRSAASS
ncbi:MAG: DUF2330 domain-containing protein [Acidimicrobiia bacterium]|jgi:hypothetical protein